MKQNPFLCPVCGDELPQNWDGKPVPHYHPDRPQLSKLARLARKYRYDVTEDDVLRLAKRGTPFFLTLMNGQVPLNTKARHDADEMQRLAFQIARGG